MEATFETKQYCPHCWPIKRRSHTPMFVAHYVNLLSDILFAPFRKVKQLFSRSKSKRNPNVPWNQLLELLSVLGIAKYESNPKLEDLIPRTRMFFDEAKLRGLDIAAGKLFGQYTNDFRFRLNGKRYYYESIPMTMWPNDFAMDSKIEAKRLLEKYGIPVAEGQAFTSAQEAFEYGRNLGYELVVKPNNGSLSNHVTCYIKNDEDLQMAIALAKQYSPSIVVERAIAGLVYRATVIGKQHVFVCLRDRANVVGDGLRTVQELLDIKNADERRAEAGMKHASVHKVPVDQGTIAFLESQEKTLEYVPGVGEKVYLYSDQKYVPDRGNDIVNCSALAHPENRQLFLRIAEILDTEMVGIDFMCTDISRPFTEQGSGVLETNSLPFIDMHQFPSQGQGDPVAKIVWDVVLERLKIN